MSVVCGKRKTQKRAIGCMRCVCIERTVIVQSTKAPLLRDGDARTGIVYRLANGGSDPSQLTGGAHAKPNPGLKIPGSFIWLHLRRMMVIIYRTIGGTIVLVSDINAAGQQSSLPLYRFVILEHNHQCPRISAAPRVPIVHTSAALRTSSPSCLAPFFEPHRRWDRCLTRYPTLLIVPTYSLMSP